MTDIVERLRAVEGSNPDRVDTQTCWYRNPDGPEAAAEIERLRKHAEAMAGMLHNVWYEWDGEPEDADRYREPLLAYRADYPKEQAKGIIYLTPETQSGRYLLVIGISPMI